jgi:hypothetical protein
LASSILRFRNSSFLWCGVVSPTPNPQPGRPGLRIYDPRRQGGPAIPPGTGWLGCLGGATPRTHYFGPLRGTWHCTLLICMFTFHKCTRWAHNEEVVSVRFPACIITEIQYWRGLHYELSNYMEQHPSLNTAFYEIRSLTAVFTGRQHWSFFCTDQSSPQQHILFLKIHFHIILLSMPRSLK